MNIIKPAIPGSGGTALPEDRKTPNKYEQKVASLLHKLWIGAMVVTGAVMLTSLVASVALTSTIAPVVFVVSTLALGMLLNVKAWNSELGYLSKLAKKVAEYALTVVVELLTLIPVGLIYFFSLARREDKVIRAELKDIEAGKKIIPLDKPPILLVHGFLDNSSSWYWQKRRLEGEGYKVYTVDLGSIFFGSPFNSVEEYAAVVQSKVKLITALHYEATDVEKKLSIVGHSMGGLVALHYTTQMAQEDGVSVTDVITLGSPLQGTKLASLAACLGSKCAEQMKCGSEFLKGFNADVVRCTRTSFHVFVSGTDEIIVPHTNAQFKEYAPHMQTERNYGTMGHLQYFLSGRVTDDMLTIFNEVPNRENVFDRDLER
jgi:hypothetical protein